MQIIKKVLGFSFIFTFSILAMDAPNKYIFIEWDKNPKAKEYQIQISDSIKFFEIFHQENTKELSIKLEPNQKFKYGRIAAIDSFGNRGKFSEIFEIEPRIVEKKQQLPKTNLSNYLTTNHLIQLDSNEPKSKGFITYYKINDGKWFNYQGGIQLDKEGKNLIQYYSEDRLGNRERMKAVEYILDTEGPVAEYKFENTFQDFDKYLYTNKDSKIELRIQDRFSGIESTQVFLRTANESIEIDWNESQPITIPDKFSDRTVELFIVAVDRIGNVKTYSQFFRHDLKAPEVSSDIFYKRESNGRLTYITQLSAYDSCSGVQAILYSINNGQVQVYQEPFTITEPGEYELKIYAIDKVGNRSPIQYERIKISENLKKNPKK